MAKRTIITISREFGSGGREIGQALASTLGIAYYDRELLVAAAKDSGMSVELFENNDENLSIDEIIDIDFNSISSDDYHVMANGQTDVKGTSSPIISATKTKENLESMGFVCDMQ